MEKTNLSKIIADNLNKAKFQSKKQPSLPGKYANGGTYLSDKGKATQFGQYKTGGSTNDPNQPYHPITNPDGYHPRITNLLTNMSVDGSIKERENFESWWPWLSNIASGGSSRKENPNYGKLTDLYRYYSGEPLKYNVLEKSKYKPSTAKDPNAEYISIKDPNFVQEVVDTYNRVSKGDLLNSTHGKEFKYPNSDTYNVSGYKNKKEAWAMGHYNVSKGKDDKGEYISYYDKFDATPGKDENLWENIGIVKPFEIYDRIYLDPKTGKPKQIYKRGGGIFPEYHSWAPPRMDKGGDISIPNLTEGNWLKKYIPKAQVGLNIPGVTDFKMPRLSNESTSLGTKIDEAAIRQAQIDRAREKQGTISKAEPKRSAASKALAIAINPVTALSYKVKGQDIPEHFDRGEQSAYDAALNIVNPAGYVDAAASIPGNISRGEFLQAGINTASLYPGLAELRGAAPELRSAINTFKKSGLLSKGLTPWRFKPQDNMMYRGIGEAGMKDALESGVFRQAGVESGVPKYNQVWYARGPKGFSRAKDFSNDFIVEIPETSFPEASMDKFRGSPGMQTRGTSKHIPITEGKILQKDWLRGYKPINTTQPTFLKSKSLFGNTLGKPLTFAEKQVLQSGTQTSSFPSSEISKKITSNLNNLPNNITKKEIEDIIDNNISWLNSDEYISRRMATTGESKNDIVNSTKKYIDEFSNDLKFKFNQDLFGDQGQYGRDSRRLFSKYANPQISISNDLTKDEFLQSLDHEIKHALSPAFKNENLYKNYPTIKIKDTPNKFKQLFYPSGLSENEKFALYLSDKPEQQVRALKLSEKIKKDLNIPKNSKLTVEQTKDWHKNYLAPNIKKYLSQGYEDIIDLMSSMDKKTTGKQFTDWLNKAWAVPSAVVGATALQQKQKGGMITDPMGQWAHPGKNTRIPGNNITMQGVPFPVLAKANNGMTTLMQPEQHYSFPGADYVDEYPIMQKGGTLPPIYTDDLNKIKAYKDSLNLYNLNKDYIDKMNNDVINTQKVRLNPSLTQEQYSNLIYTSVKAAFDASNKFLNYKRISNVPNKQSVDSNMLDFESRSDYKKLINRKTKTYKKPVQPYILQPKPQLDRQPNVQINNPSLSRQMSTQLVGMPSVSLPNTPIKKGNYMVGYFDENNQGVDRGFLTPEQRDAFVEELRQRNLSSVQPYRGNITQYYRQEYGGDPSIPNVYPNQRVPRFGPGGFIPEIPRLFRKEYGGPLKRFHQGRMTGPGIF